MIDDLSTGGSKVSYHDIKEIIVPDGISNLLDFGQREFDEVKRAIPPQCGGIAPSLPTKRFSYSEKI